MLLFMLVVSWFVAILYFTLFLCPFGYYGNKRYAFDFFCFVFFFSNALLLLTELRANFNTVESGTESGPISGSKSQQLQYKSLLSKQPLMKQTKHH